MQLTLGHHKCLIFVAMSHCELQVEYVCYETVAYIFIKCFIKCFMSHFLQLGQEIRGGCQICICKFEGKQVIREFQIKTLVFLVSSCK